jgi:hypothetical protein
VARLASAVHILQAPSPKVRRGASVLLAPCAAALRPARASSRWLCQTAVQEDMPDFFSADARSDSAVPTQLVVFGGITAVLALALIVTLVAA